MMLTDSLHPSVRLAPSTLNLSKFENHCVFWALLWIGSVCITPRREDRQRVNTLPELECKVGQLVIKANHFDYIAETVAVQATGVGKNDFITLPHLQLNTRRIWALMTLLINIIISNQ